MGKRIVVLLWLVMLVGCQKSLRVATCSAPLSRETAGQLVQDLSRKDDQDAQRLAEAIQRADPDVVLLADIDYDAAGRVTHLLMANYLAIGQNSAEPIRFAYHFTGPVNRGIASGHDLDGNGKVASKTGVPEYAGDAFAPGLFPGQHGMLLLSKYPIQTRQVRTFTRYKWKHLPGARLPNLPEEVQADLRLATTSFWDVPVIVDGKILHVLVSRPEMENPARAQDEIRFWDDYLSGKAKHLVDDTNQQGGIEARRKPRRFVILGLPAAETLAGHALIRRPVDHPEILPDVRFKDVQSGASSEVKLVWVDLKL